MSVPTLPAIVTVLPRIRRATATLAAHPPTLVTKPEVVVNSPSPGSRGIGLANISATRMPTHATSIIRASENVLYGSQYLRYRGDVEILHHGSKRNRGIGRRHTPDRPFQASDTGIRHARRHLRSPSAGQVVFLDNDQPASLADRR